MQTLVVPKNRRPKFDLTFRIIDLINIPYVSGGILVKWQVENSSEHGKHGERAPKAPIKDHKAILDYTKTMSVKLVVNKDGVLQDDFIDMDIFHEVPSGGKEERTGLGKVKINISEYVEATRRDDTPILRRHLLQDGKINSILTTEIRLNQTEGDRTFFAPPLKAASAFMGIAGVTATDDPDIPDTGDFPSSINPRNKAAVDDLKDLYHKMLAAELSGHSRVPPADKVIEDIFAGGDGWCGQLPTDDSDSFLRPGRKVEEGGHWNEGSNARKHVNRRSWTGWGHRGSAESLTTSRSGGSFQQQSTSDTDKEYGRAVPEIDELEAHADLTCWNYKLE